MALFRERKNNSTTIQPFDKLDIQRIIFKKIKVFSLTNRGIVPIYNIQRENPVKKKCYLNKIIPSKLQKVQNPILSRILKIL